MSDSDESAKFEFKCVYIGFLNICALYKRDFYISQTFTLINLYKKKKM